MKTRENETILKAERLKKYFPVQRGFLGRIFGGGTYVHAVDGIDFQIGKGEVFGLVGESGCGKTTVGKVVLRLTEPTGGRVLFEGLDMTSLGKSELRKMRRKMQVIFQDPYGSLNPRMKVKTALKDAFNLQDWNSIQKKERALEILEQVGLTPPESYLNKYPHQISGGERQRVAIARILATEPNFIVADEPLSMLDVSVKSTILKLMMELKNRFNLTYLFITHDLAVARYICDRVAVMYVGRIVEIGPFSEIFQNAQHPYTKALLSAIPPPDPRSRVSKQLPEGEVPTSINPPPGCRFHPRCPYREKKCLVEEPKLNPLEERGHRVACHRLV